MIKVLAAFFFLVVAGCSSGNIVRNGEHKEDSPGEILTDEKKALEHFIKGSVEETKGNYAAAILEYQDALRLKPEAGIYYALAKNYYVLGKIPLALQNAKKAIELEAGKIEYYDLLSDIFVSALQYDSAAAVLERVIIIDSSFINAYYKLARIYENDKPLQAIEIYGKLTEIVGPEWSVLIRVSELHRKLGNYDKAASTIEELLDLDPGNIGIQKLLSETYLQAARYDDAVNIINNILELTPDDLDARERKAQVFITRDDWKKAAEEFNYILEQKEVPLETKIRIGASYFAQSLKDSSLNRVAKELFETIDRDTLDWQVKMYLGAIAINEGRDSAAINNFSEVTKLAEWNVDGWIRLGGLYFDNRKYDEAIKVMNEAYGFFPQNFAVNLLLGLSHAQGNNHQQAKSYLKTAVDLNPGDISALSAYGYTLSQLNENDDAVYYLNLALKIQPDDINLMGTLGLIYDSQKNWILCDSIYEKALSLDSMNALINNNYAYSLSERGERLDEALQMVQISVEAEPRNSSYLDTIGWVYFKLGNYSEARKYIEEAIKVGGESAVMLEHLGDISFKMGQKDFALELWQKAFNLDSSNNQLKDKIEKGEI